MDKGKILKSKNIARNLISFALFLYFFFQPGHASSTVSDSFHNKATIECLKEQGLQQASRYSYYSFNYILKSTTHCQEITELYENGSTQDKIETTGIRIIIVSFRHTGIHSSSGFHPKTPGPQNTDEDPSRSIIG